MVAVDAQILAGVAVTVLLALLFFGVVVLWDVALALRGVADKVDKLEDTLDDDLTDLERAMDGSAGGSGAQVHLNGGGTITPGGPGAAGGARATAGAPSGATGPAQTPHASSDGRHAAERAGEPTAAESAADAAADAAGAERVERSPDSADADEPAQPDRSPQSREAIGADPTPVRDSSSAPEDRSSEGDAGDHDEAPESGDGPDSQEADPRAAVNRGRFVTSPDRTAWYRTPLDRAAIAAARSPIAGELEAGDTASAGTGEAEPAPAEAPAESTEEPIAVGPGGPSETAETTGSTDDPTTQPGSDREPADSEPSSGETDASQSDGAATNDPTEADSDAGDTPSENDEEAGDDPSAEEIGDDEGARSTVAGRAAEAAGDSDRPEGVDADGANADSVPAPDGEDPTETTEAAADDGAAPETGPADSVPEAGSADSVPEADSAESTPETHSANPSAETHSDDSVSETDSDDQSAVAGPPESTSEPDVSDATVEAASTDDADATDDAAEVGDESAAAPIDDRDEPFEPDEGMEFTFEEFSATESTEPELTVDEAVESVNDETPSLSRSAHGIESRAETDDEGVVLIYDLEESDSSGSTTRLLRYQLQSFAAESDAAVDVTVSGNRVVVDIPGADGADVSQWQAAVVEVIDRTLYLSDNSE